MTSSLSEFADLQTHKVERYILEKEMTERLLVSVILRDYLRISPIRYKTNWGLWLMSIY